MAQQEHYNAILRTLADRRGQVAVLDQPEHAARLRQAYDQLQAVRSDLQRLAEDARQQGSETLRARSGRGHNVKIDCTLSTPAPDADAMTLAVTIHVIQDAIFRNHRDAGDQLQRLLIPLSKVADPATLAFASQLERLAAQLRPPGAPRGNYAPRHL